MGSGTMAIFRRKSGDASQLCNLLQVPHDGIPLSGSGPGLLLFTRQHLVNPAEPYSSVFTCYPSSRCTEVSRNGCTHSEDGCTAGMCALCMFYAVCSLYVMAQTVTAANTSALQGNCLNHISWSEEPPQNVTFCRSKHFPALEPASYPFVCSFPKYHL